MEAIFNRFGYVLLKLKINFRDNKTFSDLYDQ